MNPAATIVHVDLGARSYDIQISSGQLGRCGESLAEFVAWTHAVVITDENVESLAMQVAESLAVHGDVGLLLVPPGETSKSVAMAEELWQQLLDLSADRRTLVVAVGGGVIGDLAGFVAATFARGLALVQVPTTLLAQVDSSVGGKVAVNLPAAKNMVGSFWQPSHVLIDTDVLESLPPREFHAGLAEVVKYGVILDADFFQHLEDQSAAILEQRADVLRAMIARCCQLKARVVEGDERETTGLRAVLNYGHTFAHAIEAISGYGQILHGEAVAIGMTCAAQLALDMGRIDRTLVDRQQALLERFQLPTRIPALDPDELIEAMQHDKKVEHGQLRFVLPTRLGHVELVDNVPPDAVRQVLVEKQ